MTVHRPDAPDNSSPPGCSTVLVHATEYVAAGLSVIPVRADGTKAPAEAGWREYSERRPTPDELRRWFGNGTVYGIGIPGGPASGNLAVLDFEERAPFDCWLSNLPSDTADYLDDCPVVRTPGGGVHVWCRLPEPVAGTVLARHAGKGVMVEVRGNGHQVVAPGSPPQCHRTGRPYEFERRGWLDGDGRVLPLSVWFEWCELAAAMNEYVPPKATPTAPPRRERDPAHVEPGTDFNQRGTWEESGLFAVGGWQWVRQLDGDRGFVRRPGKAEGISGTVGMVTSRGSGWPLFYCFTSNGHPFEHEASYDRFGVFARLSHKGDFSAAARALAVMGYGEQRKATPTPKVTPPSQPTPEPEGAPIGPRKGYQIILDYFRAAYRPVFRDGNTVHCADGSEMYQATACSAAPSKLITLLATAADAPRYAPASGGGVNEGLLPGFFKKWSGTAWADLRDALPTEDDAELGAESPSGENFRRMVREAMLTEITLGDSDNRGRTLPAERLAVIEWCKRFAKPGRPANVRSKVVYSWCESLGLNIIRLHVAIHHSLFSQLVGVDRLLRPMGADKFNRRCAKYGVGQVPRDQRVGGQRMVVLSEAFVEELLGLLNGSALPASEVDQGRGGGAGGAGTVNFRAPGEAA